MSDHTPEELMQEGYRLSEVDDLAGELWRSFNRWRFEKNNLWGPKWEYLRQDLKVPYWKAAESILKGMEQAERGELTRELAPGEHNLTEDQVNAINEKLRPEGWTFEELVAKNMPHFRDDGIA